jgi:hypothetical protein
MKPPLIATVALAMLALVSSARAQDEQQVAAAPPGQAPPPPPRRQVRTDVEKERENEPQPMKKLLWLEAEGGVETTTLNTFTENFNAFSVGFLPRTGTGPAGGGAVGVRFVFLTLGARARVASFQENDPSRNVKGWNMASFDGELGFRVPLRRLEPYLTLAAGYTTLGGFRDAVAGVSQGLNVNGFNTRLGFGVDYFVSKYISIGGALTGELLILTRPGIPVRDITSIPQTRTLDQAAVRVLEADGSSYGSALALTAGAKAHF